MDYIKWLAQSFCASTAYASTYMLGSARALILLRPSDEDKMESMEQALRKEKKLIPTVSFELSHW